MYFQSKDNVTTKGGGERNPKGSPVWPEHVTCSPVSAVFDMEQKPFLVLLGTWLAEINVDSCFRQTQWEAHRQLPHSNYTRRWIYWVRYPCPAVLLLLACTCWSFLENGSSVVVSFVIICPHKYQKYFLYQPGIIMCRLTQRLHLGPSL